MEMSHTDTAGHNDISAYASRGGRHLVLAVKYWLELCDLASTITARTSISVPGITIVSVYLPFPKLSSAYSYIENDLRVYKHVYVSSPSHRHTVLNNKAKTCPLGGEIAHYL